MIKLLKHTTIRIFFLLAVTITPFFAYCWGITGHRVIGEIAQRNLSKKAKKELRELIGNETLAQWANWADFIKSDTTHTWDQASKWHYVNLPENLSKEQFILALQQLPGENLYSQIKAMAIAVKNESLPQEQRKNALSFLVHLVGDLHQPLHVGREADQGGNRIKVTWFDKTTNLHSLWDNALVENQQYSYTEYATILNIPSESEIKFWQQSSLEEWFYESYQLANKVYALTPADSKLSYQYNYIFQKDLDQQLLKGGIRLAKMLNDLLN